MTNYNIKAEITADSKGYTAGVQSAIVSSKKLSTTLATVGLALNGLTASFKLISGAIKTVTKVVGDCTESYKVQLKAEKALDNAIKNSPLMNGESAEKLKNFASQIQKTTNYGDEQIIPLITQLTALGRSEAEAMQIVKVATDMASTGTVSMETAVTQLNATMNGSIGRLGIQNKELQKLTDEELRNGKAVEILGQKYKGMAQAVVDPSIQLKNLMGDLKETIGEKLYPTIQAFTIDSVKGIQNIINRVKELNFDRIGAVVRVVFNDIKTLLGEIFTRILQVTKTTKALFTNFASTSEFKKIVTIANTIIDVTVFLYNELSSLVEDIRQKIKDAVLFIWNNIKSFFETSNEALANSETNIKSWADFLWNQFNNIFRVVQDMVNAVSAILHGNWAVAWEYTKLTVARVADAILDLLSTIINAFPKMISKITDFLNEMIKKVNAVREFFGLDPFGLLEPLKNVDFSKSSGLEQFIKETENRIEELTGTVADRSLEDLGKFTDGATGKLSSFVDNFRNKVDEAEKENKRIVRNYQEEIEDVAEDVEASIETSNDNIEKDTKATTSAIYENVKNAGVKIADTFKKVISSIKNVFSGISNLMTKLFEFKPNEVLDNILKLEDSVLTFFVETLPKTPNFFSSVLESIGVLIKSISGAVKAEDVRAIVRGILKLFTDNLPRMVEDLVIIIEELTDGVIDALMDWLDSDEGLSKLLKLIVKIQKALEKLISKNLDKLADSLAKHTDDFADFLAESMTSANNTLPKLINAVLKIIGSVIQAVADAFKNQEFIDSIINAIIEMTNSIMDNLPRIIGSIVQLIVNIIVALAPRLPEIIMALVNGLADAIPKCIGQIVSGLAKGIGQIFKGLFERIFTWDFWVDTLKTLGEVLLQIVADVFTLGLSSLTGRGVHSTTGNTAGDLALDFLVPFGFLGHFLAKGTNNAPAGLSIVGEAGPELVRFRGGEQVLNNRNTNKALAEMGGKTNNFNVTFNNLQDTTAFSMMQQLKAYNRQMAINGIL